MLIIMSATVMLKSNPKHKDNEGFFYLSFKIAKKSQNHESTEQWRDGFKGIQVLNENSHCWNNNCLHFIDVKFAFILTEQRGKRIHWNGHMNMPFQKPCICIFASYFKSQSLLLAFKSLLWQYYFSKLCLSCKYQHFTRKDFSVILSKGFILYQ